MLERARNRKNFLLTQQRDRRNSEELQWTNRDVAAMLRREQFQYPFNHLKKGLKAKQLHAQMIADVEDSLRQRESENPVRPAKSSTSYTTVC